MNISFINSDKKLYRGKIYINKDKYNPTNLEMKFLKSFGLTIKIGSFNLKNNSNIHLEWYNSPNEISYLYEPLFYFVEFKNGYIKLDEDVISQVSMLNSSTLSILLFNNKYHNFRIEKGLIIKNQNVLTSSVRGLDTEKKVYELLFYVENEIKTTYFSKLEILYILNRNICTV